MIRPFRAIVQVYPNNNTLKLECGHVVPADKLTTRMQCVKCPLSTGDRWTWRKTR